MNTLALAILAHPDDAEFLCNLGARCISLDGINAACTNALVIPGQSLWGT